VPISPRQLRFHHDRWISAHSRGQKLGRILLGAFLVTGAAKAETVILKPSADAGISSFSQHIANNFGKSTDLILGSVRKGGVGRMLVKFDLTSLPKTAVINTAELRVSVSRESSSGGAGARYDLRRVLVDWSEGSKGGQSGGKAVPGEVTWNARKSGSDLWTTPGGDIGADFSGSTSASQVLDGAGAYSFSSTTTLVQDVQAWVNNSSSNFGWVILSESEDQAGNVRRVSAKESAKSPQLVLDYTIPPAILPPEFKGFSLNAGALELRFRAEAGNLYAVEYLDSLVTTPQWMVLTNVAAKLISSDPVIVVPADQPQRFYRLGIVGQID